MLTKFVLAFSILALVAATAGSIPVKGFTYRVTLSQPAVIQGTAFKAGEYRVNVNAGTVTFTFEKESRQIPAKIETNKYKFFSDEVRYDQDGDHLKISEICVGGTRTRLLFN
jgi:hypothetical protein